ncbi:hypothetical protein FA15DRAFT_648422 [Coprinopsis marcescibilis]|uniref:Fungal defensin Copsin domain-containing protein n=1 Tax=Coprinopsis marcescibilis TaxID=230819 RepID=A0A5C3KH67_COPMA|nr:hypothetical protein FA15DRAFT_648422 [Coprinopsis marcescibilis]
MQFKLITLAAVSFLPLAALGATNVPDCVNECFKSAATEVGCDGLDLECIKAAGENLSASAAACIKDNECTTLARGDDVQGFRGANEAMSVYSAIQPSDERPGSSTPIKRSPRGNTGMLEKRQCNSGSGICVTGGNADCADYCQSCHENSDGDCGVECADGLCAGVLGLTCACQLDCFTC